MDARLSLDMYLVGNFWPFSENDWKRRMFEKLWKMAANFQKMVENVVVSIFI